MRILVTGTTGQVGWELCRALSPLGQVLTPTRSEFDLLQPDTLSVWLDQWQPHIIVNPAAYTAVDKAESEPELAEAANHQAVASLARWCATASALLVHFSTDYVFDGRQSRPYEVTDTPGPLSVYGRSKLAGEDAIRASGCRHLILRTSWVYASRGKNFLRTMLRLANQHDSLRVVADQFGAPTPARGLADVTAQLLARQAHSLPLPSSLLHVTAAGQTSWHGFAEHLVQRGSTLGLCRRVPVQAITTAEYPTPALRPACSLLSGAELMRAYGLALPDWTVGVEHVLSEVATQNA